VIAISGGIDSALVAALAVDALGADRVIGVTMPSRFSSSGTLGDAHELGRRLGIEVLRRADQAIHDLYLD
jgi:NAD+ synthase (glutamine-hydrolysing)